MCIQSTKLSYPQDIALEARSLFGPDEILVDLEGPELISPLQTHLGGCKYAFFYKITIGGEYYLRIKVLREGYAAITETDHSFRQPYFDDVIGGPFKIGFGKVGVQPYIKYSNTLCMS
jgi:hypothetical protein